jgi:RNA polymerase sigma factor (TIGR02999 family)
MRQILVDHARARNAEKRPRAEISLDEELTYSQDKSSAVLALDEALSRLATKDVRMSKVVELKFFGGLTFDQIAQVLEVSEKTAKRDWQMARAWLRKEIRKK